MRVPIDYVGMIPKLDELVSLSNNAEADPGVTASSTSITPLSEQEATIASINLSLSNNALSDTGDSASSAIPTTEPETTILSIANLSLSNNALSDTGDSASSAIPTTEPATTILSIANYVPSPYTNNAESDTGDSASSAIPTTEPATTILSIANYVPSPYTNNAESDTGDSASSAIPTTEPATTILSIANLSLSNNAESDTGDSASSVVPKTEPEATTLFTASCLFSSDKSKTPIAGAPIPALGASAPWKTPVSEAKATTEATTSPSLFSSDKSKTPIAGAPIPALGASAPWKTPVSEAKATTEATTSPSLFGSDKSKSPIAGAPIPALGASAPWKTPVSEAKATTEATTVPSPCSGSKQPPPLTFLNVHCRGIKVSEDGSTVTRINAECGTVYSARPVHIYEKICLRFLEVTDTSSRITVGFTNCDPVTSITSSTLKWSLSLEADFCTKGTIFCYYVDVSGVVHFEINGKYRGILLDGVNTSNHLWMRLYINKFGTEVELLDLRNQANGEKVDSLLEAKIMISEMNVDDLHTPFRSVPLPLHKIKGTNVQTNVFGEAARLDSELKHGYVFIAHLLKLSYTIHIQILQTETAYSGSLAIGITTCNPDNLKPSDLPEDPRLLLRRPEYCVVSSDVASGMKRGDYLEVTLMTSGEVQVGRNGSPKETIMHVINSLPLWMFVNIYGATQKIRVIHPLNSLPPHNNPYECTLKRPPPLTFHNDPDMKDIRISKDGFKVISLDKNCGSVYSVRPVNINEQVYLRFLEVDPSFNPNSMVGFMNRDPRSLNTNVTWESVEIWNSHLKAKFHTKGPILSFSVDLAGVVRFYNDGKFEELLFKGVDTCNPFWMSLNISKTETVVQLMKMRRILRSRNSLVVDKYPTPFYSETLALHWIKSSNIQTNLFGEAARCGSELNYGYAFTAQPIQISNTIYIQILQTEKDYLKSLAFGVTSCNPEYLKPSDLREDPKLFSQQPEDWEVIKDVANDMKRGEYLEVTLRANGDFEVGRNGSRPLRHMFVNNIQPLWLFVNIYGATQKIRLLSRLNPFVFERPPRLKFIEHNHDEGIRIHEDGFTVVKLFRSDFGRAYSARPVKANEKVCLRFLELYRNPRIFIGFITTHRHNSSVFAQSKEWCKMLEPEICTIGTTFSYYFDTAGVVHFEINDEYIGNWFSRVNPKERLWACIDIESLGIVMRFVSPPKLFHNQSMSIENSPIPIPPNLTPVNLHRTKSRNVQINENGEVERLDTHFYHGYVFTAQPMELEQTIFIQILETETAYTRNLAIGLTSRDPATLDPDDLPEDSNLLLGHPDYFVVQNNKTMSDIKRSDELVLIVTLNGEVQLRRNDAPFRTLRQIDHSVPLWAFVNVYRATQKVRVLTSQLPAGNSPPQQSVSGVSPTRTTVPSLAASENTECLSIDSKRPDLSTSLAQDVAKVDQVGAECIVCKEEPVNSVLDRCGHMWMCLKCARKQLRVDRTDRCRTCREQREVYARSS